MSPKYKGRGNYFRISAENVDACGQNKAFVKHVQHSIFQFQTIKYFDYKINNSTEKSYFN